MGRCPNRAGSRARLSSLEPFVALDRFSKLEMKEFDWIDDVFDLFVRHVRTLQSGAMLSKFGGSRNQLDSYHDICEI